MSDMMTYTVAARSMRATSDNSMGNQDGHVSAQRHSNCIRRKIPELNNSLDCMKNRVNETPVL